MLTISEKLSIYSNSDIFIGKIIVIILLYLLRRKILLVTQIFL
jgi:hypothetical protein